MLKIVHINKLVLLNYFYNNLRSSYIDGVLFSTVLLEKTVHKLLHITCATLTQFLFIRKPVMCLHLLLVVAELLAQLVAYDLQATFTAMHPPPPHDSRATFSSCTTDCSLIALIWFNARARYTFGNWLLTLLANQLPTANSGRKPTN